MDHQTDAEQTLERALFNEMISAAQLHEIIDADLPDVIVFDLRTPTEQREGIIPSSHLYPCAHNLENRQDTSLFSQSFAQHFENQTLDKGKRYILICRSGPRTEIAMEAFLEQEIEACELIGGIEEWKRQNYTLSSFEGAPHYHTNIWPEKA
ncbi:rhodanese-like domain-containing protein [Magnetococcales bacterium HHB-1]